MVVQIESQDQDDDTSSIAGKRRTWKWKVTVELSGTEWKVREINTGDR